MRKLTATFALLTISALGMTSLYADEATLETATFSVEKMTCATCPIAVRKAMERVDGVQEVKVDLDSKTAIVVYDAAHASINEIGAASTNVGFPATVQDK